MDLNILIDTPSWEWPDNIDELLLGILKDKSAKESDRLLATELAGDCVVINDELVEELLSILHNGDAADDLRSIAAISLGPVIEQTDLEGFEFPGEALITEETFQKILQALRKLYMDTGLPKHLRRMILEASVRSPQDWHKETINEAYFSGDEDWKLTAVFAMGWVRGFDEQIVKELSNPNEDILYQAVCAAENWELDEAWPVVTKLVSSNDTEKELLLAAIDAVATIRPKEAGVILNDLTLSDDEDICEAAHEAIAMAEGELDAFDDDF